MRSYTNLLSEYQDITNNSATDNQTRGGRLLNDGQRFVVGSRAWPFMVKSDTVPTVASQQAYQIPAGIERVKEVTVTVGTTTYTPDEVPSEDIWQSFNWSTAPTSDIPCSYFIRGKQVLLYPTPSSSANTITVYGKRELKDLSIADYTTGTVSALAAAGTTVTGSGTTWTASMVGRYLRITESDTANKGDGLWYEIASYASATSIALTKPYEGTVITAGAAAYTIGQMPVLPEAYHVLPLFYAVWQYFMIQGDNRAASYKQQHDEILLQMVHEYGSASESMVIDDGYGRPVIDNPNLYYTL